MHIPPLQATAVSLGPGTQAGPDPQPQTAPEQVSLVPAHTMPQPPQLPASVWVFVQAVPQTVSPEGQAQAPFAQLAPVAQTLPHAPQFVGSELKFGQAPPQVGVGGPVGLVDGHMHSQVAEPTARICPDGQEVTQELDAGQKVLPVEHEDAQARSGVPEVVT
jgi:hypothetical protein